MISSAQWGAYNKAVESIVEGSRRALEAELTEWVGGHPGAGTAEIRSEAERMMRGRVQEADKAAASLAAQWYDAQGKAAGMRLDRAVTSVAFDEATVERVAHYQAQKLEDGDIPGFVEMCSELVGNDAVRSLNATIMRNAARDKRRGVKFARVTSGRNTCPWCLMLAGRGAVYHTRESAGAMGRFHRHCSCKIVPSFSGDKYEVLVEGHDPAKIEARLKEVERLTGFKRGTKEFSRDVTLRDPDWLFGDEPKGVSYLDAEVEAKKASDKDHPAETRTASRLSDCGYSTVFINDEARELDATSGRWRVVGLPDLESGLEIKNVSSAKSENTVSKHIGGAKKKRGLKAIALDFSENQNIDDKTAMAMVSNSLRRHGVDSALFIGHDLSVRYVLRK